MVLTRDYKATINERIESDPKFAVSLMNEAILSFLTGEAEEARIILRELVNSTIGFEMLAKQINKPSKSLHRMLSPKGNPTMDNLTDIFVALQKDLDFDVEVKLSSHNKRFQRDGSPAARRS
jgi:DNA-binding phage protein